MANSLSAPSIKLFYSYSHKDTKYQERMETTLALLQQEGLLDQWSDRRILPGQPIPGNIREQLDQAAIVVFLLSPDFIASSSALTS